MPGLLVTVPVSFTDNALPVLPGLDPVLPTVGALSLLDLSSAGAPLIGLPADASPVPNLAWQQSAATIGSGTQASLAGAVQIQSAFTPANACKIERSTKGGLHLISPRNGVSLAGRGVGVKLPEAVRAYIAANPGHAYFASTWRNITRATTISGVSSDAYLGNTAKGPYTLGSRAAAGATAYPATNLIASRGNPANGFTGPLCQNQATSTSANDTTWTDNSTGLWPAYAVAAGFTTTTAVAPSIVFYRFYLEDLTVSGRTYAQVDAADFAEYQKQVTTVGGRYYGDTFTDPATVI